LILLSSTLSLLRHVFGQQLLRKRTIASGGSHASVGKSLRKRQKSPQVGRDRETSGNHRPVAPEPGPQRGTRAGVEMRFPPLPPPQRGRPRQGPRPSRV